MTEITEISIIVPVYNVMRYLTECLDAISAQSFKNWECILVDDGSNDGSGNLCDEYAVKDSRFKVIHKKNGGLSAARNAGLEVCTGRYIAFIDSDDVPHERFLEKLHTLIVGHNVDVAEVSYELFFSSFRTKKHLVEKTRVLQRGELALELLYSRKVPNYMWNKLFRREVITTTFPEGKLYEDMIVMSKWINNIHTMVISPDVLYSYRQRNGSIVNSNTVRNAIEYIHALQNLADALREIEPDVITHAIVGRTLWKSLVRKGKSISRFVDDKDVRENGIIELSKIGARIPIPGLKEAGARLWLRSRMLRDHPKRFIRMMRWLDNFYVQKHYRNRQKF